MIGIGPWRIVEGTSKKKSEGVCLGRSWSNCYKSILAARAIALSVTLSGGAMFASWKLLSNSTPQTSCSKLGNWVWRFLRTRGLSLEISPNSAVELGHFSKLGGWAWRFLQTRGLSLENSPNSKKNVWSTYFWKFYTWLNIFWPCTFFLKLKNSPNWLWTGAQVRSLENSPNSTPENPRAWRKYPNPTSEFGEISNLNPWVVEISLKHLRSQKCSLESRVSQQKSIE